MSEQNELELPPVHCCWPSGRECYACKLGQARDAAAKLYRQVADELGGVSPGLRRRLEAIFVPTRELPGWLTGEAPPSADPEPAPPAFGHVEYRAERAQYDVFNSDGELMAVLPAGVLLSPEQEAIIARILGVGRWQQPGRPG